MPDPNMLTRQDINTKFQDPAVSVTKETADKAKNNSPNAILALYEISCLSYRFRLQRARFGINAYQNETLNRTMLLEDEIRPFICCQ